MICYVLAMVQQHLGPHVVVGYGIKIFWPGLFITSPDHLEWLKVLPASCFLVRLEFFSPSSTLTLDVNSWFTL